MYLTVHMKFELENVSAALNRKENTDEDADDVTHHYPILYSLLTQQNHIASSWLNFMSLLDEMQMWIAMSSANGSIAIEPYYQLTHCLYL